LFFFPLVVFSILFLLIVGFFILLWLF
jgi:hypothetical protein